MKKDGIPKKKMFGTMEYLLHDGYRSEEAAKHAAEILRAKPDKVVEKRGNEIVKAW